MLDAGSTGSRIHVYKFIQDAKGRIDVVSEVFVQVKPGLSSFATDPAGAARSLDPLMDAALEAVPKNRTSFVAAIVVCIICAAVDCLKSSSSIDRIYFLAPLSLFFSIDRFLILFP